MGRTGRERSEPLPPRRRVSTLALLRSVLPFLHSAHRLFPSGLQWLFSSCLGARGEVAITALRYLGPQWNHCSTETIKHFSLNGGNAPQTLKLFARNFTPHLLFFFFFSFWGTEALRAISARCAFLFHLLESLLSPRPRFKGLSLNLTCFLCHRNYLLWQMFSVQRWRELQLDHKCPSEESNSASCLSVCVLIWPGRWCYRKQ